MGKPLTIGQTAKRLGLEVDTVRKLERAGKIRAVRTRGGHRRFTEEEIDRYRKSRRKGTSPKSGYPRHRANPRRQPRARMVQGRHPRTGEFLPMGVEVADDFDDFDEDLPSDEFDEDIAPQAYLPPPAARPLPHPVQPPKPTAPRLASFEPRPAPLARAPVPETDFVDQLRLQTIKGYGRAAIPWNAPPEWQGKVIADLERYVTSTQFPGDLPYAKASEIVRARVAEVLRPCHEAEEKAARQKKAKDEADRRRVALLAHGTEYARRETSDWDWSASHEARDEVKKVLEREVEHDWTEREVEDEVDEVLDEWDDDEDDEGEDEWADEDD
jgi:excisionase family DNA binding protein